MPIETMSLIAALVAMSAGGVWKLSRVEVALRTAIDMARDELEERQDRYVRQIGETIAALRQKINDVELRSAETYLRRDGFHLAHEEIKASMQKLSDKMDERFVRIEEKMDRH